MSMCLRFFQIPLKDLHIKKQKISGFLNFVNYFKIDPFCVKGDKISFM